MPLWRLNINNRTSFPMRESRKFFQRGSNFDYVFLLLMMGEMIQIPIKAGHHRPSSRTPFKWRLLAGRWWPNIESLLGGCVILQGIRTSIVQKPYIFVIFQEGGVRTPCPPLWIRTCFLQCSPDLNPPFRLRSACAYVQL